MNRPLSLADTSDNVRARFVWRSVACDGSASYAPRRFSKGMYWLASGNLRSSSEKPAVYKAVVPVGKVNLANGQRGTDIEI